MRKGKIMRFSQFTGPGNTTKKDPIFQDYISAFFPNFIVSFSKPIYLLLKQMQKFGLQCLLQQQILHHPLSEDIFYDISVPILRSDPCFQTHQLQEPSSCIQSNKPCENAVPFRNVSSHSSKPPGKCASSTQSVLIQQSCHSRYQSAEPSLHSLCCKDKENKTALNSLCVFLLRSCTIMQ